MTDNVENQEAPSSIQVERDSKGRFTGSGNLKGRPKGTKGVKHRNSKAALETQMHKDGLWSFRKLREIAEKAMKDGDMNLAVKVLVMIGNKYFELTLHNDKVEMQAIKDAEARKLKEKKLIDIDENGDEDVDYSNVVINFGSVVNN